MPIEAVSYKFPPEEENVERRLDRIAEGINGIIKAGSYVGNIAVGKEGVIILVDNPDTAPDAL